MRYLITGLILIGNPAIISFLGLSSRKFLRILGIKIVNGLQTINFKLHNQPRRTEIIVGSREN